VKHLRESDLRKLEALERGSKMRYLRVLAVLGLCLIPASYAHAQRFSVGVGIGGPAYVGPAPACAYGYYNYYPYACAPYGYYGPSWFSSGVFIGAGPWFHGYARPGYYGRPGFYGRPGYYGGHAFVGRGPVYSGRGPAVGGGFRGGEARGGFHGGGGSGGGGRR
jgi:hypothetical protein